MPVEPDPEVDPFVVALEELAVGLTNLGAGLAARAAAKASNPVLATQLAESILVSQKGQSWRVALSRDPSLADRAGANKDRKTTSVHRSKPCAST